MTFWNRLTAPNDQEVLLRSLKDSKSETVELLAKALLKSVHVKNYSKLGK